MMLDDAQQLEQVRAEERERCAKIAEQFNYANNPELDRREKLMRRSIAEEIRKGSDPR